MQVDQMSVALIKFFFWTYRLTWNLFDVGNRDVQRSHYWKEEINKKRDHTERRSLITSKKL